MFDPDVAATVLDGLTNGLSLRKACAVIPIDPSTILRWANGFIEDADVAGFPQQYARARQIGYQLLGEEILEISDEEAIITITTPGVNGADPTVERRFDPVGVARNRLRTDNRKWMHSKMLPKLYGDKVDVALSGEVGIKRIERVIVGAPPKEPGA